MSETDEEYGYRTFSVPKSWIVTKLCTVFSSVSTNGKKLKLDEYLEEGEVPVIDQGEGFVGGYTNDKSKEIEVSSPLIGFGDHTRKFKFISFNFAPGADGLKVLRPIIIDEKYAYYACQAIRFPNKGYSRHFGYLSKSDFPVAPLNEQKRIVEKIEELFSQIDAGEAALKKAQALIKQYRQSLLRAAVTGELTKEWRDRNKHNLETADKRLSRIYHERQTTKTGGSIVIEKPTDLPLEWAWTSVESVCETNRKCAYGVLQPGNNLPDGKPLIRVGDINNGRINVEGLKTISQEIYNQYQRTILRGDEVLITLVGAIGRSAVVLSSLAGANIARAVGMIPVSTKHINPQWLCHWLNSPLNNQQLVGLSHEVARKTLNLEDVRRFGVAVPSKQEQDEIVQTVENLLSQIDALMGWCASELSRSNALRQSILKAAFSGQLVPQDPNDEPASVLLERIKAGREDGEASRTKRKAKTNAAPKSRKRAAA